MVEGNGRAPQAPAEVDLTQPSAARIYDWYLGGEHNWAVDREFGKHMLQTWPQARQGSRHNRQFMGRAVRAAMAAGVRQFLDLGSGVPTAGNVHQIVRENLSPGEAASVVYVDHEAVAAAHAQLVLEREDATDWAGLVQQDMRRAASVLAADETRRLIDFSQPVCVLMIAVLHFVGPDDYPDEIIRSYLDAFPAGSWLALSHMSYPDDPNEAEGVQGFAQQYQNTANPVWLRSREEIVPLFDGLRLLDPGVVHLTDWRPDTDPAQLGTHDLAARPFAWCGVGEKLPPPHP